MTTRTLSLSVTFLIQSLICCTKYKSVSGLAQQGRDVCALAASVLPPSESLSIYVALHTKGIIVRQTDARCGQQKNRANRTQIEPRSVYIGYVHHTNNYLTSSDITIR